MGYDIHITRAEDWTESQAHPITLVEWKAYVRSDREMRLDTETLGLAVWIAWKKDGVDGGHASFFYDHGEIIVKDPDRDILRKAYRIAVALKAGVQGDDGETYDADGNPHQP